MKSIAANFLMDLHQQVWGIWVAKEERTSSSCLQPSAAA